MSIRSLLRKLDDELKDLKEALIRSVATSQMYPILFNDFLLTVSIPTKGGLVVSWK